MGKPNRDILIIGAGIAGLAAGCYGQMNGYRTQILEMHDQPGGLCTSWERHGYWFDGCLHYLFGSAPGEPFHQLWQELEMIQGQEFVHHRELMRLHGPENKTLVVHCDPDRLEAHLQSLSPPDKPLIQQFCQGIREFERFDLSLLVQKPRALMSAADWGALLIKVFPLVGPVARWGLLSAADFGQRLRDPFLRWAIPQMFAWPSIPLIAGMSLLASMHRRNAGYPVGGSLSFAKALTRQYLALGGEIRYGAQVERILVERSPLLPKRRLCRRPCKHRAVGVRLYSGELLAARRVISACDGHATLFSLLGKQYLPGRYRRLYDGRLPTYSQLQVSLGVARDLSSQPHWVTHLLDAPVEIAGEFRYELSVKHYCFDPTLAPPGKSVMVVMLPTAYDYWQRIYGHASYGAQQRQVSEVVIDQLEKLYPGISADIECVDVATPLSYERYTGNWQGSNCGWLLSKRTLPLMIKGIPKTLPGLSGFYHIGQWVEPGGSVPVVAMSGRNIVQQICHEDGQSLSTRL